MSSIQPCDEGHRRTVWTRGRSDGAAAIGTATRVCSGSERQKKTDLRHLATYVSGPGQEQVSSRSISTKIVETRLVPRVVVR